MREPHVATALEALLDDETWPPVVEAIRTAKRRVDLSQLLFEPSFTPLVTPLADLLEEAGERNVRVRILVNENAAIPDSVDELRERFAGTRVDVRSFPMSPNVLHAKILLVDDEAFLIDSPYEQKYADTRLHPFGGTRRGGHVPVHSVSLRLAGPIVERIAAIFASLWTRTPLAPAEPARPRGDVELVGSAPAGVWSADPAGGILDAYEEALASARSFVYLETQYFTSPRIQRMLADALAREDGPEVILALNEHMDVPTYDQWQARRLAELGHPDHPRLGVFSLWSARRASRKAALRPIYIHSKVGIVDDRWATVGSANLDSISLHEAEEFGIPAPRNVELNAAAGDARFATSLRRRLWGEHLGDVGVWESGPPPEGHLALWRRVADENLERAKANEPLLGHALPHGELAVHGAKRVARPQRP